MAEREGPSAGGPLGPVGAGSPETRSRDRPSRWRRRGRFLRDLNLLAILIVVAAGAALLLLPGSDDGLLGLPALAVGQDAPRTIRSPRDFAIADFDTTERLRREAVARVLPIYDLQIDHGREAKARLQAAFAADAAFRGIDPGGTTQESHERGRQRAREFLRALQIVLEEDALGPLFKAADPDELRDAAVMVTQSVYERRIVDDRALLKIQAPDGLQLRILDANGTAEHEERVLDYSAIASIDQARAQVDELVSDKLRRLPADQRRPVSMVIKRLLQPNVVANRAETEHRAEAARGAVKTVVILMKSGESVVRAGERVTDRHLFILQGIDKELRAQSRFQAAAGSALLIVLLVVALYGFMNRGFRGFEPSYRDIAFLTSAYMTMLLFNWLGYKGAIWGSEAFPLITASAYRLALPVASGALLVRFVIGAEYAIAFVPLSAITAGWMMGPSLGFAVYATTGALAAASVKSVERPRTALFVAGLRAALAQGLVVLALALLDSRGLTIEDTGPEIAAAVISGLLASLLAALLLPAVEVLFAYTTALKLTDLADLNHPLLRDLLVEAPGTYHHSILVGTLAEGGARAIGANKLLARAGAYYHDIGKLKNPRGFEENVQNRFASVSPSEEAKELRMHVADGLELAAKHRLGQPLMEIIAQHHGTSVVRASYRRSLDLQPPGAPAVDEGDYAYPGPKPLSKEAGLVMLADVVEVATRDLAAEISLDVSTIEAHVRRVVTEVLESGQLETCDLTLHDIGRIIREFTAVLEDRLIRRGRMALSQVPKLSSPKVVRPPLGGELN